MIKNIILYILVSFSLGLFAQKAPNWTNPSFRELEYPARNYFTGFAHDKKEKKESIVEVTERAKQYASSELSNSVITHIKSESKIHTQEIQHNKQTAFKEYFDSQIETSSDVKINGVNVETYYDKKTNDVFALAYVKRSTASAFYSASVEKLLKDIEGNVENAKQLIAISEKNKAKEELLKTTPLFKDLKYNQDLLSAVDNSSNPNLQLDKTVDLYLEVKQLNISLEQGIFVYITGEGDNFSLLQNLLKSSFSKNGCSFTEDKNQADWVVSINTSTREDSQFHGSHFAYMNAVVSLEKRHNKQVVYEDEISQKGGSMKGYSDAVKVATKDMSEKLSENLMKHIGR